MWMHRCMILSDSYSADVWATILPLVTGYVQGQGTLYIQGWTESICTVWVHTDVYAKELCSHEQAGMYWSDEWRSTLVSHINSSSPTSKVVCTSHSWLQTNSLRPNHCPTHPAYVHVHLIQHQYHPATWSKNHTKKKRPCIILDLVFQICSGHVWSLLVHDWESTYVCDVSSHPTNCTYTYTIYLGPSWLRRALTVRGTWTALQEKQSSGRFLTCLEELLLQGPWLL